MPSDPDLPARAWDFPAWQAARLVSGAAQKSARAWTRRLPAAVVLDLSWDLHTAFRDLGIALSRLSRFRPEPEPSEPSLHDPGSHIFRAGHAIGMASTVLRDRAVREHVRHTIACGLPVGGDPQKGDPAITAAVDLAEAATAAFRIIGTSPCGDVLARDAAVGAFMRAVDNLDAAVQSLSEHAPGLDAARLEAARPGLEKAYIDLREALICSAVDFRQPGRAKQVLAMRERYPVLPHRTQHTAAGSSAQLASASFPLGSVLEAVSQPPSPARAPNGASRARRNTAIHGETR